MTKTLANFCFKIYRPSERNRKKNTTHFKRHDGEILCRPYPYGSSNMEPTSLKNKSVGQICSQMAPLSLSILLSFSIFYLYLSMPLLKQKYCETKNNATDLCQNENWTKVSFRIPWPLQQPKAPFKRLLFCMQIRGLRWKVLFFLTRPPNDSYVVWPFTEAREE